MGRIRTIKPEFFTSEDVVGLSPLARLLFIGVWCEADREGRLVWKPRTLKMRYLPADDCDINALCAELVASGLVRLYGEGLAHVPTFKRHQHVNPRESESVLPDPAMHGTREARDSDAWGTREARDSDAQGGKEGEGKEGEGDASPRDRPGAALLLPFASMATPPSKAKTTRLPADWQLPQSWRAWCVENRPDLDPDDTAEIFRDYWHAKPGKDACKLDWFATWRNWCRNQHRTPGRFNGSGAGAGAGGPPLSTDHVFD